MRVLRTLLCWVNRVFFPQRHEARFRAHSKRVAEEIRAVAARLAVTPLTDAEQQAEMCRILDPNRSPDPARWMRKICSIDPQAVRKRVELQKRAEARWADVESAARRPR